MACASPHTLTKADKVGEKIIKSTEHYVRRRTEYKCRTGGEIARVDTIECRHCHLQVAGGMPSIVDLFWGQMQSSKRHCMGAN